MGGPEFERIASIGEVKILIYSNKVIRAVLFDIDGVLVDSVRANAQLYRDVLGHFGFRGPTDAEQAQQNHRTFIDNIRSYAHGASEEQIQQMFDYGASHPQDHDMLRLIDDVEDTIVMLGRSYALGVVSSRLRMGIGRLLEHFGLAKYFPVQVGFEDTEDHKPHPAPLLFGATKLSIKPDEIVYVGDAATDVQAANAAGMKVVLCAHAALAEADMTVKRFSEILQAVRLLAE